MKTVVLYEGYLGDVSDPDTYASGMVWQWESTEAGQWAKKNVKDGKLWYINEFQPDDAVEYSVAFRVQVFGEMSDKDYTYYSLKWGNQR